MSGTFSPAVLRKIEVINLCPQLLFKSVTSGRYVRRLPLPLLRKTHLPHRMNLFALSENKRPGMTWPAAFSAPLLRKTDSLHYYVSYRLDQKRLLQLQHDCDFSVNLNSNPNSTIAIAMTLSLLPSKPKAPDELHLPLPLRSSLEKRTAQLHMLFASSNQDALDVMFASFPSVAPQNHGTKDGMSLSFLF
jgi:hypothetical protein